MKVTERRIVMQDWYESEYSKTGWESVAGWRFLDSAEDIRGWDVVEYIRIDKYGNGLLGIAEKETEIKT